MLSNCDLARESKGQAIHVLIGCNGSHVMQVIIYNIKSDGMTEVSSCTLCRSRQVYYATLSDVNLPDRCQTPLCPVRSPS